MASRRNRNTNTTIETDSVDVSEVPMDIQEEIMSDTYAEEFPVSEFPPTKEPTTEEIVSEETPEETPETENEESSANPIPDVLLENPILVSFCERYLNVLAEISEYNDKVLSQKSSEWTTSRILEKAKEFAYPTDANTAPNSEVQEAFKKWESLVTEVNQAKQNVKALTAQALGITLIAEERDPEVEKPLKEARGLANEIAKQLTAIANMTTDQDAKEGVATFLTNNPLPVVGRNQVTSVTGDGKTTPKYRVNVDVFDQDGTQRGETQQGFTKASLAISKLFPHGESIKPEELRQVWEAAGNSSENTVKDPVEFEKSGYKIVISKRK